MRLFLLTIAIAVLSACTILTGPTTGDMHAPSLPATVLCVFSSCNSQFSDKTARAGDDVANADKSGVAQTSENAPVVTVPKVMP